MHRRIGLSAGIVSIGRMPGRVVKKFEVGLWPRGYYCAYANELATGCTAGEQLPWQQQTFQL